MPSVQHLKVSHCIVTADLEDGTNRLALLNLRFLSIRDAGAIVPWEGIDCPLITKISVLEIYTFDNASFLAFLPSVGMLSEIRLYPSPVQLSSLARVAPQI
jgi:hypothetical protein